MHTIAKTKKGIERFLFLKKSVHGHFYMSFWLKFSTFAKTSKKYQNSDSGIKKKTKNIRFFNIILQIPRLKAKKYKYGNTVPVKKSILEIHRINHHTSHTKSHEPYSNMKRFSAFIKHNRKDHNGVPPLNAHRKHAESASLQKDLDQLVKWDSKWQIAFHPDKCQVIGISRRRSVYRNIYYLHWHTLSHKASAKYLELLSPNI